MYSGSTPLVNLRATSRRGPPRARSRRGGHAANVAAKLGHRPTRPRYPTTRAIIERGASTVNGWSSGKTPGGGSPRFGDVSGTGSRLEPIRAETYSREEFEGKMNGETDAAAKPERARPSTTGGACRFCGATLNVLVTDLGMSPPCESFLSADQLSGAGGLLSARRRGSARPCCLVQLPDHVAPEDIFTEYAYFSSFSDAWLDHAATTPHAQIAALGPRPRVASSSRSAQQRRLLAAATSSSRAFRCSGIEPARNVAAGRRGRGVPTVAEFFGQRAGRALRGRGPPGRPHRRQQRAGPGARHQRLRGRPRRCSSRPRAW